MDVDDRQLQELGGEPRQHGQCAAFEALLAVARQLPPPTDTALARQRRLTSLEKARGVERRKLLQTKLNEAEKEHIATRGQIAILTALSAECRPVLARVSTSTLGQVHRGLCENVVFPTVGHRYRTARRPRSFSATTKSGVSREGISPPPGAFLVQHGGRRRFEEGKFAVDGSASKRTLLADMSGVAHTSGDDGGLPRVPGYVGRGRSQAPASARLQDGRLPVFGDTRWRPSGVANLVHGLLPHLRLPPVCWR